MKGFIDWYSFTLKIPDSIKTDILPFHRMSRHIVARTLGPELDSVLLPPGRVDGVNSWALGKGRFPFDMSIKNTLTNSTIFLGARTDFILVELSGRACRHHLQDGSLEGIIERTRANCTRMDVSADILCSVLPVDFANQRSRRRNAASSINHSDTGDTVYIGSPNSDRRAAVYRYNPPLPRSDYLRVEHRFSSDAAKVIAAYYVKFGVDKALHAAAANYGWQHELWVNPPESPPKLPPVALSQKDGKKLHWVMKQVIPALRSYEQEGIIPDLRLFLEEHLFENSDGEKI